MSRRARSFNQFENGQAPGASASFSSGGSMPSAAPSHSAFQNVKDEHTRLFGEVKSLTSKFMDQIRMYKEHGEEVKRLMKAHEELLQDVQSTQASIPFDALLNEVKDVIQLHEQFVREGKGVSPEMLRQVQDIALRLQNTSIELQRELDDEKVALESRRLGQTDFGSWLGSMWPFPSVRSIWHSFKSFLPWFLVLLLAFGTYNLFFADRSSSSRYSRSVRQPTAPGVHMHHTGESPAYLRHVDDRRIPQYDDRTVLERVSDSVSSTIGDAKDRIVHKAQEKAEGLRETVHDAKETVKTNLHAAADVASDVASRLKHKAGEAIQDTKAKLEDWKEKASDVVDNAREKASELGERASRTYERVKDRAEDVLDSAKDKAERVYDKTREVASDAYHAAKHKARDAAEVAEETWEKAKDKAEDVWDATKDKAKQAVHQADRAWEATKDKAEDAWDKTKDTARQAADKAGDAWDKTKDKAEDVYDKAKDTVQRAAHRAGETWEATKDKAEDAWDKTKDKAEDVYDKAKDTAQRAAHRAGETWEATKDKAEDVWDKTKDTARQAADKAGDAWDATKDKAERAYDKTKDKAEDAWDATKDQAHRAANRADDAWEATKDKARDVADRAGEKWEQTKDRAGEKWEQAKDSAQDSARRGEERIREAGQDYRHRQAEENYDGDRHRESHYKAQHRYSSIPADEVHTHYGHVQDRHPPRSLGDAVADKMHDIGDKLSNAKDRVMDKVHHIKDRVSNALRSEAPSRDYPAGLSEADTMETHPDHPAVDSMPYSPVPYLVTGFIGLAILLAVVTVLTAAAQARAEGEELAVRRKAHSLHPHHHQHARVLDDKLTVERDTVQMDKDGNVFETRRVNQFDVAAA